MVGITSGGEVGADPTALVVAATNAADIGIIGGLRGKTRQSFGAFGHLIGGRGVLIRNVRGGLCQVDIPIGLVRTACSPSQCGRVCADIACRKVFGGFAGGNGRGEFYLYVGTIVARGHVSRTKTDILTLVVTHI